MFSTTEGCRIRTTMRAVRLAALAAVVAALLPATSASAFTLIQPTVKLYVNPKAGYTTSLVQVRGTLTFQGGPCPTTTPESFSFTFDSKPLWSRTVPGCNPSTGLWDTSWSAYIVPPVTRTVGNHTIAMTVATATVKTTYTIYPAPAPPSPRAGPTPGSSPSSSPSATSTICPTAANLPPPGAGGLVDNFIAGAMVAAVLPLIGMALFGPTQLLTAIGRRRRWLHLLGLSLLVAATLSCTSSTPTASTESPSTSAPAAAGSSPSASPSC